MSHSNVFVLLLVVENKDDAFLFVRAAASTDSVRVICVASGEEAKDYLLGAGSFAQREVYPFPNAIVTDVAILIADGSPLTHWIRNQSSFAGIPVAMLTASLISSDQFRAFEAGANRFFSKPVSVQDYRTLIKALTKFFREVWDSTEESREIRLDEIAAIQSVA